MNQNTLNCVLVMLVCFAFNCEILSPVYLPLCDQSENGISSSVL